ncbi:MAG: hypothetical protein ACTTH7_07305 [Treponema sp.]
MHDEFHHAQNSWAQTQEYAQHTPPPFVSRGKMQKNYFFSIFSIVLLYLNIPLRQRYALLKKYAIFCYRQ